MAYGYTPQEESAREKVRTCLHHNLSEDEYVLERFRTDPLTFALCTKPFKREKIVTQVVSILQRGGFTITRDATVKSGKYTYAFLEVDKAIVIEVGPARRGGQGIFVSTIAKMNEALVEHVRFLKKKEDDHLMTEQIKAKLNDDEIAFLGWKR